VRFIRLGGENDVSRVKRGDGIKTFEKHWVNKTTLMQVSFNTV